MYMYVHVLQLLIFTDACILVAVSSTCHFYLFVAQAKIVLCSIFSLLTESPGPRNDITVMISYRTFC